MYVNSGRYRSASALQYLMEMRANHISNVTRLPPFSQSVHVEAEIPVSPRDEFERAIVDIVAGAHPRMDALDRPATIIGENLSL
jgi:hypothetical protein